MGVLGRVPFVGDMYWRTREGPISSMPLRVQYPIFVWKDRSMIPATIVRPNGLSLTGGYPLLRRDSQIFRSQFSLGHHHRLGRRLHTGRVCAPSRERWPHASGFRRRGRFAWDEWDIDGGRQYASYCSASLAQVTSQDIKRRLWAGRRTHVIIWLMPWGFAPVG